MGYTAHVWMGFRIPSQLYQHGFKTIDALEPYEEMLEEARKKNVYQSFICDFLGTNRLSIEDSESGLR